MDSEAFDIVERAAHPSPEEGGPCATCAFRPGTEANRSEHTRELAKLCVQGYRKFHCHEAPQMCRGWIAAINLQPLPSTDDERRRAEAAGIAADVLGAAIADAAEADRLAGN